MLAFIKRRGPAVLWSWGNYRYTVDCGDNTDVLIMNNHSYEDALAIFESKF